MKQIETSTRADNGEPFIGGTWQGRGKLAKKEFARLSEDFTGGVVRGSKEIQRDPAASCMNA